MKLTFRGNRIYSSIRLDEINTMVANSYYWYGGIMVDGKHVLLLYV